MKKFILVLSLFLVFGCAGVQPGTDTPIKSKTTDCYGPIGNDLENWEFVANAPIMTPYGVYFDVYATNKDSKHKVQFLNFLMSSEGEVVQYYITINSEFQSYKFNSETNCFDRVEIPKDVIDILRNDFREYFGLELNK